MAHTLTTEDLQRFIGGTLNWENRQDDTVSRYIIGDLRVEESGTGRTLAFDFDSGEILEGQEWKKEDLRYAQIDLASYTAVWQGHDSLLLKYLRPGQAIVLFTRSDAA